MYRGRFGVGPICRTLGVSASAYYHRATGARSVRTVEDERLLERIEEVHAANYHCYGYRRTWKALRREGVEVGRDRVKRLMRQHGIQGAKRRGKPWRTTVADPTASRPPDLVNRDLLSRPAGCALGRGLHLPALLGRHGVLQLRHRRLQPQGRGLAVRRPHAHHPRSRRAADGALTPRQWRRRRAHSPFRCRVARWIQVVVATP